MIRMLLKICFVITIWFTISIPASGQRVCSGESYSYYYLDLDELIYEGKGNVSDGTFESNYSVPHYAMNDGSGSTMSCNNGSNTYYGLISNAQDNGATVNLSFTWTITGGEIFSEEGESLGTTFTGTVTRNSSDACYLDSNFHCGVFVGGVVWDSEASSHSIALEFFSTVSNGATTCTKELSDVLDIPVLPQKTIGDLVVDLCLEDESASTVQVSLENGSIACKNCDLLGGTSVDNQSFIETFSNGMLVDLSDHGAEQGENYYFKVVERSPQCTFHDNEDNATVYIPNQVPSITITPTEPTCIGGENGSLNFQLSSVLTDDEFNYSYQMMELKGEDPCTLTGAGNLEVTYDGVSYCLTGTAVTKSNTANSNSDNAYSLSNLVAGVYWIQVQMVRGNVYSCPVEYVRVIQDPDPISITKNNESTSPSCVGGNNGKLVFDLENEVFKDGTDDVNTEIAYILTEGTGTSAREISSGNWTQGTYEIGGIPASGNYYLEVSDRCVAKDYIGAATLDNFQLDDGENSMNVSVSSVPISCFDNGSITVEVTNSEDIGGGTVGYSYQIKDSEEISFPIMSNEGLSVEFKDLSADTYTAAVTSPIGCEISTTSELSLELTLPEPVTITLGKNSPTCNGAKGGITVAFGSTQRTDFDFDFQYKESSATDYGDPVKITSITNETNTILFSELSSGSYDIQYKDNCRGGGFNDPTSKTINDAPAAISFVEDNSDNYVDDGATFWLSCFNDLITVQFAYKDGYNGTDDKNVSLQLSIRNSFGVYGDVTSSPFNFSTENSLSVSDLGRGDYRAIIEDTNCGDTDELFFSIASEAMAQLSASAVRELNPMNDDGSQYHLSCNGEDDGELSVSISGGVPGVAPNYYLVSLRDLDDTPLTQYQANYNSYSNGTATYRFSGLSANVGYSVHLEDFGSKAGACSIDVNKEDVGNALTLDAPAKLTINPVNGESFTNEQSYAGNFYVQCKGGTVDYLASATGGNPAYSFSLYFKATASEPFPTEANKTASATNVSTATYSNLTAGFYKIEVDDQQNCDADAVLFEIKEADVALSVAAFEVNLKSHQSAITCLNDADGQITVGASGGVGNYSYRLWNAAISYDETITTSNSTATFSNLRATDDSDELIAYHLALHDEISCEWLNSEGNADTTATMSIPDTVKISDWRIASRMINGFEIPCRSDEATLDFTATGGDGAQYTLMVEGENYLAKRVQFNVPFNPTDSLATISLQAGAYDVLIKDQLECTSAVLSFTLTQPDTLTLVETSNTFPPCIYGQDGRIEVSANGGFPYSGGYRFRIKADTLNAAFGEDTVGGTRAVFYVPAAKSGYADQRYFVQVQDSNLCITEMPVIMEYNRDYLTLETVSVQPPSCDHGSDGSIVVRATNFTLKANDQLRYRISGGHFGTSIKDSVVTVDPSAGEHEITFTNLWDTKEVYELGGVSIAGHYEIWVEDFHECPDTASQYLNGGTLRLQAPEPLVLSTHDWSSPSCVRGENGWFVLQATGGVPPYAFAFEDGDFEPSNSANTSLYRVEDLSAGTYTVYLKDANFQESQPTCMISYDIEIPEGFDMEFTNSEVTNVSCYGGSDGMLDVDLYTQYSGAAYGYDSDSLSLYWITDTDTLGTAFHLHGLSKGLYSLSARYEVDSLTCEEQQDFRVLAPDAPFEIDDLTVYDSPCGDLNGGKAIVTFKGGWSDSTLYYNLDATGWERIMGSSLALSGLSVAEHHLEVAQNQSKVCVDALTFEIATTAMTVEVASALAPTCSDDHNGEVILVASGLNPQFSIVGTSTTNTTGVFSGLTYGVYQFAVQDVSNTMCVSDTITISFSACVDDTDEVEIQSISILQESTCLASQDGEAFISVRGGLSPYQYYLNGALASESVTSLAYGRYEVVVEDALQKRDTATFELDTLSPLSVRDIVTTNVSCVGSCDGAVSGMAITGGSGFYRVVWEDDTEGSTRTGLCAGTYGFTVYDTRNDLCGFEGTVEVVSYDALAVSSSQLTAPTCVGDANGTLAVLATGGSNSFDYSWSHGSTGRRLSDVSAGDYTVTVTDQLLGCKLTATFTLPEGQTIEVTDTALTSPSCEGGSDGSIELTVGQVTAPFVQWQHGDIGTYINGLSAGDYGYTIESTLGCELSGAVTLEDREPLAAVVITADNTCYGQCGGILVLSISGGESPYYVEWSTGSRSTRLTNLCNGTYSYTITDRLGCVISGEETIGSPDPVEITLTKPTNVSCFGLSDGELQVAVTGGTGTYRYSWTNGDTTALATVLASGQYTVTVTDSNGCSASEPYTVTQPEILYTFNDEVTDPSCAGYADGDILLHPEGGTQPYSYAWSDGSITQELQELTQGIYDLVLTDANGCRYEKSYELSEPEAMYLANISYEDPICHDAATGSIDLTAFGGTAPLNYSWASGQATASIAGITPGDYVLTVKDAQGCVLEEHFTLANPAIPPIFGLDDYMVMCDGGTILLSTEGEWKTYLWEGPEGTFSTASNWAITAEGDYHVTVTDENDCPAEKSMYLEVGENVLVADFIRISEAYTYEPMVFVDLTLPTPDAVNWVLPETDAIVVNEMDELTMELVFVETGKYLIGVEATYGMCRSEIFKVVTIEESTDGRTGGNTNERKWVTTRIYPNPAKDKLNIKVNVPQREQLKLQLVNMSNTVLHEQEMEGRLDYLIDWELSHLTSGVYLLIVRQGDLTQTKRILIVR